MAILIIVLRAVHILGGIFWTGAVITLYGFVLPSTRATQPESARFTSQLAGRSGLTAWMTAASAACLLAGLALYAPISGRFDRDWLRSTRGMVLSLGALVGVLAALEGLMVLGPTARRLGAVGREIEAAGGPPTPAQAAELGRLQDKLGRTGTRAAWMLGIAALLMAVARYI